MDKTHYERRSHEQGNYEITPTYKGQVVVTIKSLATGQTMQVYLDEPTQTVDHGKNVTNYTGHFYEDEFMVTPSEGFEITGLPLMYPYRNINVDGITIVIDTENHYYSEKDKVSTDPFNLVEAPYSIVFVDAPFGQGGTSNLVQYDFTRFGTESDDNVGPTIPPGEVVVTPGGEEAHPIQN